MRIGFSAIARWLESEGPSLTMNQLEELRSRLNTAENKIREADAKLAEAYQAAEAAAAAAGLSLEELMRRNRQNRPVREKDVRKPYMNPFDPASELCFIPKSGNRAKPAWAEKLLAEGWSIDELHYKRHATAMRARGKEPLYDAVARYKELTA